RELKASMSLLNLKFEKILGMGGEGVAALFSATTKKKASGKAAEKELFVAKVPINWDPQYKEDLAKERRITARFEGSLHIVQLRHAQAKRRIKFEKGLAKKLVLLEYLGGGTLGHVLRKASDKRMRFPSRVLWIIFDCLIKGLIGLRFPPKRYHKNHDRFDTHNLWAEHHVHFDLDTTNIFLGEIGQTYQGLPNDDHRLFPIAKIADLGVMTHVTPELRASPSSLWWLRTDGKLQHYAPEQFTEEWDFVDQLPDPNVHKTAGKFSWKTNLYQVALIMVALITGFLPQYPPVPKFKTLPAPFFRVATKGKKKPQRSGYTYGSYFLGEPENAPAKGKKWHHVDPDLRNLVAHCMFDQPDKRPSMEELYFYIQGKLK
ncbi:kinase-like domain-containing protein, partial [Podospora fimiseda]